MVSVIYCDCRCRCCLNNKELFQSNIILFNWYVFICLFLLNVSLVEHQMSAVQDELKKIIKKVEDKVNGEHDHLQKVDKLMEQIQEEVHNQLSEEGASVS